MAIIIKTITIHHLLIEVGVFRKAMQIKFVINNDQDLSYCELNTIPTELQINWFKNNMQYLDRNQKELFMQKTKIAIKRISTIIEKIS